MVSYKYLGITLDRQLNYNLHVKSIIGSVTAKLKQFQRMRSFLTIKAATMVYKGMLLPILEYGDIFLTATTAENKRRLQTLQNKGLRCALGKGLECGSDELHNEAKLLKLKHRRQQHLLNHMFDQAQNAKNYRQRPSSGVKMRSQNKKLLKIKRPYTERFKKSFGYLGPKLWNALPERFHHAPCKLTYKNMIANWVSSKEEVFPDTVNI